MSETTQPTPTESAEFTVTKTEPTKDVIEAAPENTYKVYKPSSSNAVLLPPPPPPDDYFAVSAADVKAQQAYLTQRTNSLVNAPLEVRAAREAAAKAKRDRWPYTTIRIRFTDRTQLEKTFPSTDKIRSVYAFVLGLLREDVKRIKFILYQTPPKRELKVSDPAVKNLSLSELQLSPSSILHLQFLDDSLNHTNYPAPLAPDVLSKAIDLPPPPNFDKQPSPDAKPSPQANPLANASKSIAAGVASAEKKIPKWFKGIGKK